MSAAAIGAVRRISTREATTTLASAITSTDATASDADDQVDPQSSANCTIDLVSSSMKPAPRKKKCHNRRRASEVTSEGSRRLDRTTSKTAIVDTARTIPSAAR